MKIAGGALFGGPFGAAFSAVQVAVLDKEEVEITIPAGGVNAESVAGNYPFADPSGKANLEQHPLNKHFLPMDNNIPNPAYHYVQTSRRYNSQHAPKVYLDGMPNLAREHIKKDQEILIANKSSQKPVYDVTALIKNTYDI